MKSSIIDEILISTSFFLFSLSPSSSSSISSTYTKTPTSPSSVCYPEASEATQYSVRSVQRCAAHCSVLPTCRRFNYYYQSNVYGTAGDCRLFPSSNCLDVPNINGFLAYVNNALSNPPQPTIETTEEATTTTELPTTATDMAKSFDCALNNPCKNALPGSPNLYPHIIPAKFIQCSNGACYPMDCAPGTNFNNAVKVCT